MSGRGIHALRGSVVIVIGLILGPWAPAPAEVSEDPTGFLQMALETGDHGTDGSPFPWSRFRPGPTHAVLNENGDNEGDGRPAFALDESSLPLVTWPDARPGGTHVIVISHWTGSEWSEPEEISEDGPDVADPALDVAPDGTLAVAWWEPETGTLAWVRRRPPGGSWQPPEPVGDEGAIRRFPTVAATADDIVIAFSAETGGTFEVRAALRSHGWAEQVLDSGLVESRWRGRGDVALELHRVNGVVWADWLRSTTELATSRLDPATGSWSAPESIPCEPTADGWRRARFEARRRALGW